MSKQLANKLGVAAPAERPKTIAGLLSDPKIKQQMALALPKHMTAERLARIAMTEIRKTPKLAQADQASFLGAIMQCAQLGLEPGSALGHAYLLPFENRKKGITEVQFIIGYRGMLDLVRRSGQIESFHCYTVHEKDKFKVSLGLNPTIEHEPAYNAADRGKVTFVYAVAKLKDGGTQFEVMNRVEIERVRASSKASTSGPWVSHWDEMAKKTVIRRLFKYLPVSIELQSAVGYDELADAGVSQQNHTVIDGESFQIPDVAEESVDKETGEITDTESQSYDPLPLVILSEAETLEALEEQMKSIVAGDNDDMIEKAKHIYIKKKHELK